MGDTIENTQLAAAEQWAADQQQLQTMAQRIAEEAQAYSVVDAETYETAGEIVVRIANAEKRIHKDCDPMCEATDQAHKKTVQYRQRLLDGLEAARRRLKAQMDAWSQEQKRKARDDQAKLQVQVVSREADVRLSEAVAVDQMGDHQAAEAILAHPAPVPTVVVKPAIPKVQGVTFRTIWEPVIDDEAQVPREYLMLDMVKIRRVVSALKDQTKIPGIRAQSKRV